MWLSFNLTQNGSGSLVHELGAEYTVFSWWLIRPLFFNQTAGQACVYPLS